MENYAVNIIEAVRANRLDEARGGFETLLTEEKDDHKILLVVHKVILALARKNNQELCVSFLEQAQNRLMCYFAFGQIASNEDLAKEAVHFMQSMVYTVCDRKITAAFPIMGSFSLCLSRVLTSKQAEAFWQEWLNLAAQMARRGWQAETSWLLRTTFCGVYLAKDLRLLTMVLQQLVLYFTAHAKWDGFYKACEAYVDLFYFYLMLLRKVEKTDQPEAERVALLQLALRNVRYLMSNAARVTMVDDMESFRAWYQFLWQYAGTNKLRRKRLLNLLQLAIMYWAGTLPKTSRKQMKHLEDLLTPDMVSPLQRELMKKIC